METIHILSLGAGMQSSTMALMAAAGEITPMPVAGVFADTQAEPHSVYRWLAWLEMQLPFPVLRVSKGSLEKRCLKVYWSERNAKPTFMGIPAFVENADGSKGLMTRQCTRDFKVDPITKMTNAERRRLVSAAVSLADTKAFLWIGISIDEVHRAKEHRNTPYIENRFPLFEHRMKRADCSRWMELHNYPQPPRSACVFCPYHSDAEWQRLKTEEPEDFARAVRFERDYQAAIVGGTLVGKPWLHRSMKPLDQVDFSTEEERGQLNLFNNECEGMCGV